MGSVFCGCPPHTRSFDRGPSAFFFVPGGGPSSMYKGPESRAIPLLFEPLSGLKCPADSEGAAQEAPAGHVGRPCCVMAWIHEGPVGNSVGG